MAVPIATISTSLSSLPPELWACLAKDPVRDRLQLSADHFFNLVSWATGIVALGVVLEAVEVVHVVLVWARRKKRMRLERANWKQLSEIYPCGDVSNVQQSHADDFRLMKFMLPMGTILVALGVCGEFWFGTQLENSHNAIHKYDLAEIAAADDKADSAATSATVAHQEVDAVSDESKAIQKRLGTASEQLTVIEKRVRTQGPRGLVLADNASAFIRDLKPFEGSRITILMCGGGVSPIEQLGTEQRLLNILGKSGPNWTAANWETGYSSWKECPATSANGLELTVGGDASESLKTAARFLRDELLKFGIATSLHVVPPEQEQFWAVAPRGADSPEARAARDSTTIFLLVAPNAMVEAAKPPTN